MRYSRIWRTVVPGFTWSGREPVHVGIALVADDEALLGIEHGKTLQHVLQRCIELFMLLGQAGVELLALLRCRMPLAQIADGKHLDVLQPRAERLACHFDGNRYASGCLQPRLPAPDRSGRRLILQQVVNAPALHVVKGASAQFGRPLVQVDDCVLLREQESLIVSRDVQGLPNRMQQFWTGSLAPPAFRGDERGGDEMTTQADCLAPASLPPRPLTPVEVAGWN